MSLKFTVGDLTVHRLIEQETTFLPALEMLPGLTPELLSENRAWKGMAHFENDAEMLARPQLDISQIGLVCVLGYADFRFADCGWRKAYPKLDAFHHKMLERPSVKISVPPAA